MTSSRPRWVNAISVALCALACAFLLIAPALAAGPQRHHASTRHHALSRTHGHHAARHAGARTRHGAGPRTAAVPRRLAAAARAAALADRRLVRAAQGVKSCRAAHANTPGRCGRERRALQRAGGRLAAAEARLAAVARRGNTHVSAARHRRHTPRRDPRAAPQLGVAGSALRWSRVARVGEYVLMRAVPGQAAQYRLVGGLSYTPPPVPGSTVTYRVRSAARGSAWSPQRSIAYARGSSLAKGFGASHLHQSGHGGHERAQGGGTPDPQAAPEVTVSGSTLSWNQVAAVTTYVLATMVPGQPTSYSEVTGTSTTPPAVPGATVGYSVRTAVEGSAWSPQVSISYPAAPPPPVPPPPTAPPPGGGSFEMGAVAGSGALYELPWMTALGAHTARMGFSISTPVSQLEPVVAAYATAGVKPLLLATFTSRLPTTTEAQNLGSWAAAFGPGGTFWRTHNLPTSAAVTDIEFGNETSYTYQFSDNSPSAYASRAQTYALRFRDAQVAIAQANASVGLLAQADNGGTGNTLWVDSMFSAVPDLASRVAGWTVHPYGPNWQTRMDQLQSAVRQHGAPESIPMYVTEWGLATDNGRCLDDNYGWNPCMSYQEAGEKLTGTVASMRARYGTKLRAFYLFQARDQAATGTSTNREYYFGAMQISQASKGPYTAAVQSLLAANP